MTWKNAQRQAYEATEQLAVNREKLIIKAYRDSYNQISTELRSLYLKMQAEGIPKGEYYNYMTKFNRLDALEKQLFKDIQALTREANNIQLATNAQTFTDQYYRKMYLVNWTQDADQVFVVMNDKVLQTTTKSNIEFWKGVADKWGEGKEFIIPTGKTMRHYLATGNAKALTEITDIINNAFIRGESYTKTARLIRDRLGVANSNALRIARTEGLRTANAGSLANTNIAIDSGIPVVRQWDATLDSVTRKTHTAADTQTEDKNGLFHVGGQSGPYPGALSSAGENANCRCSIIDIVDGVSPELRRARNPVTGKTDIISFKSYPDWAKDNGLKWTNKGWVKK